MAKRRKTGTIRIKKRSPERFIFFLNIMMAIGIISLTVYDYSMGNSIFDHSSAPRVLSAHATPTPTLVPHL